MYLRVGASGSGHTRFIQDLSKTCDLKLFTKHTVTANKWFRGPCQKFSTMVRRCKEKKMVAFDNMQQKDMCRASPIVYLNGDDKIDTYVFSVNDRGMKSCGAVDADDVLRHAFGEGGFDGHSHMLYRKISEIHHMLPDGTVRILACGGAKLADPIVLTRLECMEREVARVCGVVVKVEKADVKAEDASGEEGGAASGGGESSWAHGLVGGRSVSGGASHGLAAERKLHGCKHRDIDVPFDDWWCSCSWCTDLNDGCRYGACQLCGKHASDIHTHACTCPWTCRCHKCADDRDEERARCKVEEKDEMMAADASGEEGAAAGGAGESSRGGSEG